MSRPRHRRNDIALTHVEQERFERDGSAWRARALVARPLTVLTVQRKLRRRALDRLQRRRTVGTLHAPMTAILVLERLALRDARQTLRTVVADELFRDAVRADERRALGAAVHARQIKRRRTVAAQPRRF